MIYLSISFIVRLYNYVIKQLVEIVNVSYYTQYVYYSTQHMDNWLHFCEIQIKYCTASHLAIKTLTGTVNLIQCNSKSS